MATEQERLKAIIDAGVATDADKEAFTKAGGTIVEGVATLGPASAEVAAPAPAPAAESGATDFEDHVDEESFKRGGSQFFMPSQEGFFKSKLVESMKPTFTEKEQRWFIFETDDPKLKAQGRGVIAAEFTKGAFKEKDVLDGLNIAHTAVNGVVKYSIKFPLGCYADWSRDPKGLGEVRISGLRTLDAGAAVEKAI